MRYPSAFLLLLCVHLSGCSYFTARSQAANAAAYDLRQVKADMQPLNRLEPCRTTEAIERYFEFYSLNPTNALHCFGTIESKGKILAVHLFLPKKPKGTLFLLHGYFDHTGTFSKLIAEGVSQEYAVVCWDLPGHGLSTGIRTDTGAFHLCAEQFADIIQQGSEYLPAPFHLIAHSTGCSIGLEYLYNSDNPVFGKIIFMAPLVQHEHWGWAKFGYWIANPFTDSVRRRDTINSSDEAYLAFAKKDPLHSSRLSFEYLDDLYTWEKKIRDYPVWNGSILIIQGDRDEIVNWDYNLQFLKSKISNPQINMVEGANHQLANESEALRRQVFRLIFEYLP